MDDTRSLTRSALSVARAKRTRRLASLSSVRRRPSSAQAEKIADAGIPFDPAYFHGLLQPHLGLGSNVSDRCLHDGFLAERGQDLCDVPQEGTARAEDQHAIAN